MEKSGTGASFKNHSPWLGCHASFQSINLSNQKRLKGIQTVFTLTGPVSQDHTPKDSKPLVLLRNADRVLSDAYVSIKTYKKLNFGRSMGHQH